MPTTRKPTARKSKTVRRANPRTTSAKKRSITKPGPRKTARTSATKKTTMKKSSAKKTGARKTTSKSIARKTYQKAGFAQISGTFDGDINTSGNVVLTSGAICNGKVSASSVRIDGSFKGTLVAKHDVQVSRGANVRGTFNATRFIIGEGATFDGKVKVTRRAA